MRLWRSPAQVPADLGRTAVTVGNFDGVHRGHQRVVARTREVAEETGGGQVVAVTFDPHPIAVLRPEHAPPTLTSIEERAALLARCGVDAVLVVPFDREVAAWSPERFVTEVLLETLHAAAVVVGSNFRFGARAAGDVEGAAEALGRPVTVRGPVQRGDRRGRELGYPTANVATQGRAVPADGVYAGWVCVLDSGQRHPAAISVGTNPTFAGERSRRVEAYVLDRTDLELYDREVEVVLAHRLRGMLRFDSVEGLLEAMAEDVERARALLGVGGAGT